MNSYLRVTGALYFIDQSSDSKTLIGGIQMQQPPDPYSQFQQPYNEPTSPYAPPPLPYTVPPRRPSGFCNYLNCIKSFYEPANPGDDYIVECNDGAYSQSGSERGACSYHGGVMRPLYSH